MISGRSQIKLLVMAFIRQQAELYGNEIIFTNDNLKKRIWNQHDAETLQQFASRISQCTRCSLSATRTNFVFGSGNSRAKLMLIGEAPGEEEDIQGQPFVGKAGQLLDKILHAVGFERDEVYVANILKCRPKNNRDPLPEEIIQCIPYLKQQIKLLNPAILLALGRIAAQALLNTTASLNQLRGKDHVFQGIPLLVTYHPAALLRNSEWKRPVWEDVQRVRRLYDQLVGDKGTWKPVKQK